jgi:hypothetical protein
MLTQSAIPTALFGGASRLFVYQPLRSTDRADRVGGA